MNAGYVSSEMSFLIMLIFSFQGECGWSKLSSFKIEQKSVLQSKEIWHEASHL